MTPYLLMAALLGASPEGELTLKTGDLVVTMDSPAAWTIRSLQYRGEPLLLPLGGQGAVIATGGRQYGSASSAGTTETVDSLLATVDGQQAKLSLPQTLTGQKLTVTKTSQLAGLRHTATTTFAGDVIVQEHRFAAAADLAWETFCPFVYSWAPQAQMALAQARDGQLLRYSFRHDNSTWPSAPARWVAQYDPATQTALLAVITRPLPGVGGRLAFRDGADCHQLSYQPLADCLVAGDELSCGLALQPFSALPDLWEARAQELAEALVKNHGAALASGEAAPRRYGEGVPETGLLTCRTAGYTVVFSAEQAWSIHEMAYGGAEAKARIFSGHNGYHGAVLVPQGGQFWGTGHTEGGAEVVHSLRLEVDGAQRPVKVGETVTGHRLSLHKESTIWKLRLATDVTVTDDLVLERTRLQALDDCSLDLMYYFMHCFVPTTTRWLACLPDGAFADGPLGQTDEMLVNADTRWVAQYEPTWQASLLAYTPRVIKGPGSCSMIWDRAHYHKYYLRSNQARALKAGETLDYSVVVQVVPGETGDWAATKAAAAALAKLYPALPE
jgi:hypothetical protein